MFEVEYSLVSRYGDLYFQLAWSCGTYQRSNYHNTCEKLPLMLIEISDGVSVEEDIMVVRTDGTGGVCVSKVSTPEVLAHPAVF